MRSCGELPIPAGRPPPPAWCVASLGDKVISTARPCEPAQGWFLPHAGWAQALAGEPSAQGEYLWNNFYVPSRLTGRADRIPQTALDFVS